MDGLAIGPQRGYPGAIPRCPAFPLAQRYAFLDNGRRRRARSATGTIAGMPGGKGRAMRFDGAILLGSAKIELRLDTRQGHPITNEVIPPPDPEELRKADLF